MSDPTRWTLATLLGSMLAWVAYRAGKWHSSSPNFPNLDAAGEWEAHAATAIAQAQNDRATTETLTRYRNEMLFDDDMWDAWQKFLSGRRTQQEDAS